MGLLKRKITQQVKGYNKDPLRDTTQDERSNVDYGFVRGKEIFESEDGPLIANKESYNCYLLVVDKYSRHLWVFLFADKSLPIEIITNFLSIYGRK